MHRLISVLFVWAVAKAVSSTYEVTPVTESSKLEAHFTNDPWTDIGPEIDAAHESQDALNAEMDQVIENDLESVSGSESEEASESEMISRGGQRIMGGERADIRFHPYQVSIQCIRFPDLSLCGGSIISEHWVLTAAHCLSSPYPLHYKVRAGSNHVNSEGILYNVSRIHRHNYKEKFLENDIGVIRIASAFTYGASIQPISLAESMPEPGTSAIVAGWGLTSPNGSGSEHLRAVNLTVMSQEACKMVTSTSQPFNEKSMFCAGYLPGGRAACSGDSGGALVTGGVQVGIQIASRCDIPKLPTIFTDVAYFRKWIKSYTGV